MENEFELIELNIEKIILNKTPTRYKVRQVFANSIHVYALVMPEVKIDQLFAVAAISSWHTFEIFIASSSEFANYKFYLSDRNRRRWILHSALGILRNEEDLLFWKYDVPPFQVKLPLPNLTINAAPSLKVDGQLLTTD
jgi:hypothetical protein